MPAMRPAPTPHRFRRATLAGLLVAALVAVVVVVRASGSPSWFDAAATPTPAAPAPTAATEATSSPAPPTLALTPTADWHTAAPPGTRIEGYADRTSVLPGGSVALRVSATAGSFTVAAFRMGSYGTEQAALAWQGGPYPLVAQPAPAFAPDTRTVTAPWQQSATVTATDWPPGAYLLRLQGADGAQSYVPLTVRSPTTAGRIVLVQAVTTWQAYNSWGGWSLYHGPDGQGESRAYAVSFDRPY